MRAPVSVPFAIVAWSALAGCMTDVSRHPPFAGVAGRDVVLLRPTEVWRLRSRGWATGYWDGMYREHELVEVHDAGPYPSRRPDGERVAVLPPGTMLRVEAVNAWSCPGNVAFVALAQVRVGPASESVPVEYLWGGQGWLRRAAWEPCDAPEDRQVGYTGTEYAPRNRRPGPATPPATQPSGPCP